MLKCIFLSIVVSKFGNGIVILFFFNWLLLVSLLRYHYTRFTAHKIFLSYRFLVSFVGWYFDQNVVSHKSKLVSRSSITDLLGLFQECHYFESLAGKPSVDQTSAMF